MTNKFSTGRTALCVAGQGMRCTVFACAQQATVQPLRGTSDGSAFCDDHWLPEDVRVLRDNREGFIMGSPNPRNIKEKSP